jgi:geranylgeranyl pyrophosphate synthase
LVREQPSDWESKVIEIVNATDAAAYTQNAAVEAARSAVSAVDHLTDNLATEQLKRICWAAIARKQ